MTMEDLYDHMKSALRHFGLHFSEMGKVTVKMSADGISFAHGGVTITISGDGAS